MKVLVLVLLSISFVVLTNAQLGGSYQSSGVYQPRPQTNSQSDRQHSPRENSRSFTSKRQKGSKRKATEIGGYGGYGIPYLGNGGYGTGYGTFGFYGSGGKYTNYGVSGHGGFGFDPYRGIPNPGYGYGYGYGGYGGNNKNEKEKEKEDEEKEGSGEGSDEDNKDNSSGGYGGGGYGGYPGGGYGGYPGGGYGGYPGGGYGGYPGGGYGGYPGGGYGFPGFYGGPGPEPCIPISIAKQIFRPQLFPMGLYPKHFRPTPNIYFTAIPNFVRRDLELHSEATEQKRFRTKYMITTDCPIAATSCPVVLSKLSNSEINLCDFKTVVACRFEMESNKERKDNKVCGVMTPVTVFKGEAIKVAVSIPKKCNKGLQAIPSNKKEVFVLSRNATFMKSKAFTENDIFLSDNKENRAFLEAMANDCPGQ